MGFNVYLDQLNDAQRRAITAWVHGPADGTAGQLRKRLAGLADAPACTELTAAWCPVHGDCTCDRESDSWNEFDCPLHNSASTHPETRS